MLPCCVVERQPAQLGPGADSRVVPVFKQFHSISPLGQHPPELALGAGSAQRCWCTSQLMYIPTSPYCDALSRCTRNRETPVGAGGMQGLLLMQIPPFWDPPFPNSGLFSPFSSDHIGVSQSQAAIPARSTEETPPALGESSIFSPMAGREGGRKAPRIPWVSHSEVRRTRRSQER